MSVKRGNGGRIAPASFIKKARTDQVVSFSPISFLPLEILVAIFEYAPPLARLHVISLVCKVWRSAVLRSITSVRFYNPFKDRYWPARLDGDEGTLPQTTGLFPSLVHLTIDSICTCRYCLLVPTHLRSLELSSCYIDKLLTAEQSHASTTMLSWKFPSLTTLSITYTVSDAPMCPILGFLATHSSQLVELKLRSPTNYKHQNAYPLLKSLVALSFPALLDLCVDFIPAKLLRIMLQAAPKLTNLDIRASVYIFDIPPPLLAPLSSFVASEEWMWDPTMTNFCLKLPKLRHISWLGDVQLVRLPESLRRYIRNYTLPPDEPWRTLECYPNVGELTVPATWPWIGTVVDVKLPFLRSIVLGSQEEPWVICKVVKLLERVLHHYPRLRNVVLYAQDRGAVNKWQQLAKVVHLAMLCGVRSVTLAMKTRESELNKHMPFAMKYKWIRLYTC